MPIVDHGDTDDDELGLYVAAFRRVEQPDPARRDASWRAIAQQTAPAQRRWLWIGAAATLLAAAWLLWSVDVLRLPLLDRTELGMRGDQAGYQPVDDELVEHASTREVPQPEPAPPAAIEVPTAVEPVPVVVPEPPPTPSKPRSKAVRPAPTLADETALFAEIQQALVAGQPARALTAIARHEREFPRGAFGQERVVAKAQALCAVGKTVAARQLRDRFVARNPSSHLAPRMRAVCPE
jgi:hypothetical protein